MTEVLIGLVVGVVLVFSIARVMFGSGIAVALSGIVGACFGGPPGAGIGIVLGLVLVPITSVLAVVIAPEDCE